MPDHEKDNDSLSRFFQKAAHKPQIKFEEGDWKKLEVMLDAREPRAMTDNQFPWKTVLVSVIATLFFPISMYVFISYDDADRSNEPKAGKSDRIVDDVKYIAPQDFDLSNQSHSTKTNELMNHPQSQSLEEDTNKSSNARRMPVVPQGQTITSLKTLKQKPVVSDRSTRKSVALHAEEDTVHKVQSQYNTAEGLSSDKDEALEMKISDRALQYPLSKYTTGFRKPIDSVHTLPLQVETLLPKKKTELIHADSIPGRDDASSPSRWSILLTLSPDFSSNGLRKFTSPGEAWGMLVYYRLNDVLSISAGAIKSNKIYKDDGINYLPGNSSFWAKNTNGVTPSEIQGTCGILEIPLSLRYNIYDVKRSRIYVEAGFSSYVMLSESYRYTFEAPNPGAVEGWNAKKTSHSLFSITNFSVGYELSISRQLSIGISPYFKIPISGIGAWANVKLYSTGAALTVRYSLYKRGKKE